MLRITVNSWVGRGMEGVTHVCEQGGGGGGFVRGVDRDCPTQSTYDRVNPIQGIIPSV